MATKEESIRYEALPKPELDGLMTVIPDTEEFRDSNKAKALILQLKLEAGSSIAEDDYDGYTINPKMVLEGDSPEQYKKQTDALKKILTKKEITAISQAISRNTKEYNKKLYDKINKKIDSFYYRGNIKKSVLPEIKEALELLKHNNTYIQNVVYHLLSKGSESFLICYKAAWQNKPIPNIQEWREHNDGEYTVLTDDEANDRARDYLDEDWKEVVANGNTEQGKEEWIEDNLDEGRTSIAGYDSCEESQEVNGVRYYIYRTN